jgi:hypothetical protein
MKLIGKKNINQKFWIKTGLIVAGGYLLYNLFKKFTGDGTQSSPDAIDCDSIWNNPKYTKQLSYDKNSYFVRAESIWSNNFGYSAWWPMLYEYDVAVGNTLKEMNNDMDVAALICAYGEKDCDILTTCTLPEVVANLLDNDIKDEVNANYRSKGITFTW